MGKEKGHGTGRRGTAPRRMFVPNQRLYLGIDLSPCAEKQNKELGTDYRAKIFVSYELFSNNNHWQMLQDDASCKGGYKYVTERVNVQAHSIFLEILFREEAAAEYVIFCCSLPIVVLGHFPKHLNGPG
ncbi:hypothetical protein HAX54_046130 [Datura stramonium]|uniref:Uncharacterized protein n=1 Tax=Datura stramonium TaxID=4076 RepID=A0ABS8SR17_DATST|nr:hypothetical protein [Datura stramonium]